MAVDPSISIVVVPKRTIRSIFNQNQYWNRARGPNREFNQKLRRDKPAPYSSNEPRGTRSQMVMYINSVGQMVALVHQYLRPDGRLGGKGRPDPKILIHAGVETGLIPTIYNPKQDTGGSHTVASARPMIAGHARATASGKAGAYL
jgi:hypothetical protein